MAANRNTGDWVKGDLLKITHSHIICPADIDGIWPNVYSSEAFTGTNDKTILEGKIVLALDSKPRLGQASSVRVIHDGSIWVVNSNYAERTWAAKEQEKICTIVNQEIC